ncbi:AMP-binding protein [Microlunatus soli]|uniref:Propionyl-CoA synthetase n=1 Tax=Microlunatus soli TaxID=630515 RepID=A0A1H1SWH2_9ACTN|nr:AMP-binding protein [Microlunatus soli]SDS52387.1 propionyl-CoA synthetase [Microlunatus soli]
MGAYAESYRRSIEDPEGFWLQQADAIDWFTRPRSAHSTEPAGSGDVDRWFADGVLNTSYNALDRHVIGGRGEQPALIFHSEVTGRRRSFSYADLLERVGKLGGALTALGVGKGDGVVIYLPMIPEAVIAMLACARIGAVHSVVFGGFAPAELAKRIDDAQPVVIISAAYGLEADRVIAYKPMLDTALELSEHQPRHCVIVPRNDHADAPVVEMSEPRDLDLAALMRDARIEPAVPVEVAATDPLYILYTSGTTGKPKGIVRDNGGHAVALSYAMRSIFDVGPGEVMFTASDVGWVVGHSFIAYAPLLVGATTVLYEGKPVSALRQAQDTAGGQAQDAGAFWRVVAEHGVRVLFTAPTAIRAIRKVDPDGEAIAASDLSTLQTLFLAGERLDPDTYRWADDQLGVPVVDHWWQTETGWPIVANLRGLEPMPIKPGSSTVPVPGYQVAILDEHGTPVPVGAEGAICLRRPLPPGTLTGVWGDPQRFVTGYLETYPGYYLTGDGGYLDDDGYLFVMGRTDDVINVAGHRLSTGQLEAVLATHPAVAECAVIGVADPLKGQLPRGLVVIKSGVEIDHDQLRDELVALVRQEIGAIASLRRIDAVPALPKTRSGKVLRKTMREIADGQHTQVPSTIEDPSVIDGLRPILTQ